MIWKGWLMCLKGGRKATLRTALMLPVCLDGLMVFASWRMLWARPTHRLSPVQARRAVALGIHGGENAAFAIGANIWYWKRTFRQVRNLYAQTCIDHHRGICGV